MCGTGTGVPDARGVRAVGWRHSCLCLSLAEGHLCTGTSALRLGSGQALCHTIRATVCQITREINFRNAASSNKQKPPRKRRAIQIRPSALASKETAKAPNHIRSAILRIMVADYIWEREAKGYSSIFHVLPLSWLDQLWPDELLTWSTGP